MKFEVAAILVLGAVLSASGLTTKHFNGHNSWGNQWGSGPGSWNNDWDNNWSGHSGHSGSRPGSCNFSPQENKRIVKEFYQKVIGNRNVSIADKYISATTYIQHNPLMADGLAAFKKTAGEWFEGQPVEKIDFQRVSAEDDLVWLHIRTVENGKTVSVMDIFRMECGKIVEHWDVTQELPATSANDHPLF